jgi:hypothetical protein
MYRLLVVGLAALAGGCSMTRLTANTTADVLALAAPAMNSESDVQLAREAAPASLKTVEGFLQASPENEEMLAIVAEGYCSYAFGFIESDWEDFDLAHKTDEADAVAKRATTLYQRCESYGLRLLAVEGGFDAKALEGDQRTFEKRLADLDEEQVPGLFWTALGLASAINLNRDDIEMVAYMPKVKAMFERVVKLDEKFYNGGAHLALGMLYTAQSKEVGGDPDLGKKHFERAIELTDGKFLMPQVLMAMNYGSIQHDQAFFHDRLVKVLDTPASIWPEQRLANELALVRARRYLAHEKELF